ncbi:hypothetical protein [uncultured Candidatus Kuenenia sp.]|jgi:hypothetical protein|uniref:hypothetical protein n=1 Tax=uncultured Candidatus Kuenenia sp. TaxID=1048336 RepID=UPI0003161D7B|nr:hypothetical protein [uncultured Candidatus Kuenenia sp.]
MSSIIRLFFRESSDETMLSPGFLTVFFDLGFERITEMIIVMKQMMGMLKNIYLRVVIIYRKTKSLTSEVLYLLQTLIMQGWYEKRNFQYLYLIIRNTLAF